MLMLLPNGNFIGNRAGVIFANATQTTAGSADAATVYTLPNHTFRYLSGLGLIVCDIDAAPGAGATEVKFQINNVEVPVTSATDGAITIADVTAGLHILVFNKFANKIQFIV